MIGKWLAVALALGIAVPARANPPPSTHHGSAAGDDDDDDDDDDAKPAAKKPPPKKAPAGDDDDDDDDDTVTRAAPKSPAAPASGPVASPKQNLAGHAMGDASTGNKDRFFVDKTDTERTANRTLIQGSLTLSTFLYTESGGAYGGATSANTIGDDTSAPSIYWGDLRLQTDFRHIAGGRWDARADFRLRVVNTPSNDILGPGSSSYITQIDTQKNLIQSGLVGQNEYDLRELWATHSGESTDVTIGRQFIQDLGAVKVDGVRVDYASSQRFTYLGFAGLYPVRGSRSLTTDYAGGVDPFTGKDDGSITGAAGGGAAYRTQQAYGSFGVVGLVPIDAPSDTRVFVTSTGYWRINPKLDFYHFAIVDVLTNAGLTNLSLGLNYKPIDRLRVTASFNRVDTDTINVQAAQFLTSATPAPASPTVLNEIYIARIAANEARASVSGALGDQKRFELTVAAAYRERPSFDLNLTPVPASGSGVPIDAAQSMEIYASFTDRRSIAKLRLGIDGMDSFPIGNNPYDRVKLYSVRVFAGRSFLSDRGEWEAEVSYTSATDVDSAGFGCTPTMADPAGYASCYGASKNGMLALGGTVYYRFLRDWFGVASMYFERTTDTTLAPADQNDAAILGFTGYLRIAYRF